MKKYQKILVLFVAAVFMMSVASVALASEDEMININTAPVEQLIKLKRIGPAYAERIIQYREANGTFTNSEDIMKVKGIGRKTYEANKDVMVVK
ncbi:MAG: helix-hairpin-helix domain-containing protein [Syntrophobacterales bacterium]|nr:MAG: helix-hairpin-helix domain-containing protein [Syntrophobacterales bacterium]